MSDDLQTPEERPVLFDIEELIQSLGDDERIRALRQALAAAEKDMTDHIATVLLKSGQPLDQRKIDYIRGYYAGAHYWLEGRMKTAKQRLANPVDPARDPRLEGGDLSV